MWGNVFLVMAVIVTNPGNIATSTAQPCGVSTATYSSLPMAFEPNVGQTDPTVSVLARGAGYTVFLRPSDVTFAYAQYRGSRKYGEATQVSVSALRLSLVGARKDAEVAVEGKLPGRVHHFIGNDPEGWRTDIPTYRSARFAQVYPGVDVVYHGSNSQLQYDFIVQPGKNPDRIRIRFEGATTARALKSGDLELKFNGRAIRFSKPVAYQEAPSGRTYVAARWRVASRKGQAPTAFFMLGPYDRSRTLVIDPHLWYSTYLGGSLNDGAMDIAVSPLGEAFVTGATASPDFPVTPGVLQPVYSGGNMDVFVTRLDPSGSVLQYSTYLGSKGDEIGLSICLNNNGQAHVTGFTNNPGFPVTPGAYDVIHNGQRDVFASVLSPDGARLVYSTFIGGGADEEGREIRMMPNGFFFAIAGGSDSQNYPVTAGCFGPFLSGGIDAVFTMIIPQGQGAGDLLYSTYIGGPGNEIANCMDIDVWGRAHLGGLVTAPGFPVSQQPFQPVIGGSVDGFVFTLTPQGLGGADMVYSSYLGGRDTDEVRGLVWEQTHQGFFVTGLTKSLDFPIVPGAFQTVIAGQTDAFVCLIRPVNLGPPDLMCSTYLGGAGDDSGEDIDQGNPEPFIIGTTDSLNFPVTPTAIQPAKAGQTDAFVTRMVPLLNFPIYSSYWGGEANDRGWGIALDRDANAYLCGTTDSRMFPVTPSAYDTSANGLDDGWVSKLGIGRATDLAVSAATGKIGETVTLRAQLTFCYNGNPVAGKTIQFHVDGTLVGNAPTGGTGWALLAYTIDEASGAGVRTIEAFWAGDATAGPSNGKDDLRVTKAPTSLLVTDRTQTITEVIDLRGYLRRTTDGTWVVGRTVTFSIDGSVVGSGNTDSNGKAIYMYTVPAGSATRTIGGTFAGDAAYDPSSGTGTLTCLSWRTKMVGFDRTVRISGRTELKARLLRYDNVPLYNKAVDFYVDGTFVITRPTDVSGYAKYPFYDVPDGAGAGTRTILSQWAGNAGYAASSATATLTVQKAIPYIWLLPRTVPQGGIYRLYCYFRRLYDYQKQEGKTLSFSIDGTWIADVITGVAPTDPGVARYNYNTTGLGVGDHTARCDWAGDAWVDAGYGEANLRIY